MDMLDKCDSSYAVWIYNFLMSLFSITFFGAWFNFYLIWSLIGWAVVIWVALQHNPYQFKLCSCNMPYWLSLFFFLFFVELLHASWISFEVICWLIDFFWQHVKPKNLESLIQWKWLMQKDWLPNFYATMKCNNNFCTWAMMPLRLITWWTN